MDEIADVLREDMRCRWGGQGKERRWQEAVRGAYRSIGRWARIRSAVGSKVCTTLRDEARLNTN